MKIIIGSDHAGLNLKKKIKKFLEKKKIEYEDVGPFTEDSVDYPDYAKKVGKKVAKDKKSKGILICGTGTGMAIAANKIKGIRAVTPSDTYTAKMSRYDNDANVIGLRGRKFSQEKSIKILEVWLKTEFSKIPRHKRRINKIE